LYFCLSLFLASLHSIIIASHSSQSITPFPILTSSFFFFRTGWRHWEKVCNEKGGIKVSNQSYHVQVDIWDDAGNEDLVDEIWYHLARNKSIDFFLGPFGSRFSSIAAKHLDSQGQFLREPLSLSPNLTPCSFCKCNIPELHR